MAATQQDKIIRIRVDPQSSAPGINSINGQLQSLITTAGGTSSGMSRLATNFGSVGAGASRAGAAMGAANSNTSALGGAFGSLNATTLAAANQLGRFNGVLSSMAFAGASAGTLALAGSLAYATTQASGYTDKLVEITTLVDTAKFKMDDLNAGLKEQSSLFGGQPIAQAGAAYEIISSGASSAADALGTLASANKLAAAGNTDVMVAAGGLTSVINSWGPSILTATAATDSFFIAIRDGKTTAEELSSAIGNVAPIAAQMGLSLDDVNASIAAMTKGGVATSVAVTNIRAALTAVIKPSQEAAELAGKLGLDFSSAALKAKGWPVFLQDIKDKSKGSQDAMAILMGGTEALGAVLSLTGSASKDFAASLENMRNKAGVTDQAMSKLAESPGYQMGKILASISVAAISVGEVLTSALLPALAFTADNFGLVVEVITVAALPVMARMAVMAGTTLAAAFGTLAGTIAMGATSMALNFTRLSVAQGVLATTTTVLTGAMRGLFAVFGGPWGALIAGIAAGIYYLSTRQSDAVVSSASLQDATSKLNAVIADPTATNSAINNASALIGSHMAAAQAAIARTRAEIGLARAIAAGAGAAAEGKGAWGALRNIPVVGPLIPSLARGVGYVANNRANNAQAELDQLELDANNARGAQLRARFGYKPPAKNEKVDTLDLKSLLAKPAGAGKSAGAGDAERKANQEKDFWATLKNELETAKLFGIEASKYTKERELHKILGRDISTIEKERVDTAIQDIANAKAVTGMKQRTFELANEYTVELVRQVGLTEAQKSVEDELFKTRLASLNSSVDINSADYKLAEAGLKTQLDKNAALREQNALLAKAMDFAKTYSPSLQMGFDTKAIEDGKTAFLAAFEAGAIKDAWGNPIGNETRDAIVRGADQAIAVLKNKPLELLANVSPTVQQKIEVDRVNTEHEARLGVLNDPATKLSNEDRAQAIKDEARVYREEFNAATAIVANNFTDRMTSAVDGLADIVGMFSSGMADAIRGFGTAMQRVKGLGEASNPTNQLMGMLSGQLQDGFTKSAKGMTDFKAGFADLGNPLKNLTDSFDPTKGGSALKGIGSAVGGAMAGYEIGSSVGGLGKSLGIKGFEGGAKIGGTVGGLTGNPLIAAGASVIGGLIGSMFYKPKYATANLQGADPAAVTGNKKGLREAAGTAAGSVQDGLASMAERLGGAVGAFDVMIGQYEGKWRVRDSASGWNGKGGLNSKGQSGVGLNDFGDDAEAAISYAISNAIRDGAITGLSDFASRAIKALDVDSAISLIDAFKKITDELDAMADPIGAAARSINKPLDSLIEQMKKVGASTADLGKIEEYRSKKLDEALKSQLSSLNSFMDDLKGEGSGITKVSRLDTDMAKFEDFKGRIAAGDSSVDQGEFTALGQSIFGLARDVFGTATGQFQDIRSMLIASTTGLGDNVTQDFNQAAGITPATVSPIDPTAAAIAASTNAVVNSHNAQTNLIANDNAIIKDLLKQLVGNTAVPQVNSYSGGGGRSGARNGQVYTQLV